MPTKTLDPIDLIKVYLTDDGSILLTRPRGVATTMRKRSDSLLTPAVLNEGDGFQAFVFDNRHRFRGACDIVRVLDAMKDDVSYAWRAGRLPGGLHVIAIRTPYEVVQEWTDLRGNRSA